MDDVFVSFNEVSSIETSGNPITETASENSSDAGDSGPEEVPDRAIAARWRFIRCQMCDGVG